MVISTFLINHYLLYSASFPQRSCMHKYSIYLHAASFRITISLTCSISHILTRPLTYSFIHLLTSCSLSLSQRSDYLYRQVREMVKPFPNVYVPTWRIATIWGGASLLQMLLRSIEEIETVLQEWDWDFFINMSESDYPLK